MITIIPNYITQQESDSVIEYLKTLFDEGKKGLNRSVLRFGLTRSYSSDKASDTIPDTLKYLADKLIDDGYCSEIRHVTVNRYKPGQTIPFHIDNPEAGARITIISLASDAVLQFKDKKNKVDNYDVPARSLTQFSDEHRWNMQHSIMPVSKLRYSIVFRKH